MHEVYKYLNIGVRIYMGNWIVLMAHVNRGSFSNLYKATMPPATDGMMVEGEKINQSMNSMIYVMIRVIHILVMDLPQGFNSEFYGVTTKQ